MVTSENILELLDVEIGLMQAINPEQKEMHLSREHYNMLCEALGQPELHLFRGYKVLPIASES